MDAQYPEIIQRKIFVVKYIHNWLPVGSHVSRYDPKYPASCPLCGYEREDFLHMLGCPMRRELQTKLFRDINNYNKKQKSDPYLCILLIRSLKNLITNERLFIDNPDPKYNRLIYHQSQVGWDQILKGWFVLEWSELIDEYIASNGNVSKKFSGNIWVIGISKIIFDYSWKVWNDCNEDRHGRDNTEKANSRLAQAIRSTELLYRFQLDVLPAHKQVFYATIEEHLEKEDSTRKLDTWISTWSAVIHHSVKQAKEMGVKGTRAIYEFFTREE